MYCVAPKKESLDLDAEATGGEGDEVCHLPAGTALVKALDSATACDDSVLEGMEAHSTPLRCLELPRLAASYPDLLDSLQESPMLYQDILGQLLNCLRLFSFTTWPAPPAQVKPPPSAPEEPAPSAPEEQAVSATEEPVPSAPEEPAPSATVEPAFPATEEPVPPAPVEPIK